MTYRMTGDCDAGLFAWKNLKFEALAALPVWDASYEGRVIFITTPGGNYGMWLGGTAGWVRPPSASPVGVYTVGSDPNDDFTNAYDALDHVKDEAVVQYAILLIRDSQNFSTGAGVASILLTEKTIRFVGMPSATQGRPTITAANTTSQTVQMQRGALIFENIKISFTGLMVSATNRLFDMLTPSPIYLWGAELVGEGGSVGSVIGLGADGSVSGENVNVWAFGSRCEHLSSGVVFSHKGPVASAANLLTVWSFGSEWGAQCTENESTDGTTTQITSVYLSTGCRVTSANAFNTVGRKTCIVYVPPDYHTYTAQAAPGITETYLGADAKVEGTYAPVFYAPVGGTKLYHHLAGIDAALGAGAGPPGLAIVPGFGNYGSLSAAVAAAPGLGALYPPVMSNFAEEFGTVTILPPLPGTAGLRAALEGRAVGSIQANDQDLLLHGNGKDNCIRNVTSTNLKGVPVGPYPYPRGTFDYLSLTCLGVRDDNELIAGDAGSPYFAEGFTFLGGGYWKWKLQCCEIRRGINLLGIDYGVSAFELDWQFTKFYVPVEDIPLDPAAPQNINGCEFFSTFTLEAPSPVAVAAEACYFATEPLVDADVTLELYDCVVGNKYYSHAVITNAGIVEASIGIPTLQEAQILAMVPATGMVVFNTTRSVAQFYDGTQWVDMTGDLLPPNVYALPLTGDPSVVLPTLPPGSTLWLGAGLYTCADFIDFSTKPYRLQGQGRDKTQLLWPAGVPSGNPHILIGQADSEVLDMTIIFADASVAGIASGPSADRLRLEDLYLYGTCTTALSLQGPAPYMERVQAENFTPGGDVLNIAGTAADPTALYCIFYGLGDITPMTAIAAQNGRFRNSLFRTASTNAMCVYLAAGSDYTEIVDNEILADDGFTWGVDVNSASCRVSKNRIHGNGQILGVRVQELRTEVKRNRIVSDTGGVVWAIVLNSGTNQNVCENEIVMEDALGNIGIDIIGDQTRSIFNDNTITQSGPVPNGPFLNAVPISTTVAVTFSVVDGNIFSAAIGGAGFAASSVLGANLLT